MKADVVVAEDPGLLQLGTRYARISGARLVYMPFEYYPGASYATAAESERWTEIEKRCAAHVHSWIMLGDKIAELYAGVLAPKEAVHVVYSGWPKSVTGGAPRLRKAIQASPEVRTILYQGIVAERRGLWDVLDAMLLLPEWVHFAVLGMGETERLRQDARDRGLAGRVHVLGAVPQVELIDYAKDADIGIIPIRRVGLSYDLCSPSKLFECIGAGLPLVVSRLQQLEWYVTRHGIGEVFDIQSPRDIARAVMSMLSNQEHLARCRERCRRLQEQEACWEVQANRLQQAVLGEHMPIDSHAITARFAAAAESGHLGTEPRHERFGSTSEPTGH
jgi:glycosyltransferase involved in cell wall biosynthesis